MLSPSASRLPFSLGSKDVYVFVLVMLWWAASVAVVVCLKFVLSAHNLNYPYPFACSGLMNIATGLLGFLFYRHSSNSNPTLPRSSVARTQILHLFSLPVMVIGVIQGIDVGLSNKILQMINVSDRQMLTAMMPLVMFIIALSMRLETFSWSLLGIMLIISVGAILCNQASLQSASPLFLAVLSLGASSSAAKWGVTQMLLQRSKASSPTELVSLVSPYTASVCFLMSFCFEQDVYLRHGAGDLSITTAGGWQKFPLVAGCLVVCALGVFALMFAEFTIVKLTSALAFAIFQSMHNFFIIAAGIIIFSDQVTIIRIVGYIIAQLGIFAYAIQRFSRDDEVNSPAAEWLLESRHADASAEGKRKKYEKQLWKHAEQEEDEVLLP